MAVAAKGVASNRPVEIRIRFEPGLGMALYASIEAGEVGTVTVARNLGRGRAMLRYRGFTLMTQGAPDWREGQSFSVVVKEVGPPLLLASIDANAKDGQRVTTVDSAVVPGGGESAAAGR